MKQYLFIHKVMDGATIDRALGITIPAHTDEEAGAIAQLIHDRLSKHTETGRIQFKELFNLTDNVKVDWKPR